MDGTIQQFPDRMNHQINAIEELQKDLLITKRQFEGKQEDEGDGEGEEEGETDLQEEIDSIEKKIQDKLKEVNTYKKLASKDSSRVIDAIEKVNQQLDDLRSSKEQKKKELRLKTKKVSKTGDKKQIYELARKSYLAVEDSNYSQYDMIHTENFMLIDKERQIRGFYDGTNSEEINRLLKNIEILKQSYNK